VPKKRAVDTNERVSVVASASDEASANVQTVAATAAQRIGDVVSLIQDVAA
jgi:phosphatidylserine decarboxylase